MAVSEVYDIGKTLRTDVNPYLKCTFDHQTSYNELFQNAEQSTTSLSRTMADFAQNGEVGEVYSGEENGYMHSSVIHDMLNKVLDEDPVADIDNCNVGTSNLQCNAANYPQLPISWEVQNSLHISNKQEYSNISTGYEPVNFGLLTLNTDMPSGDHRSYEPATLLTLASIQSAVGEGNMPMTLSKHYAGHAQLQDYSAYHATKCDKSSDSGYTSHPSQHDHLQLQTEMTELPNQTQLRNYIELMCERSAEPGVLEHAANFAPLNLPSNVAGDCQFTANSNGLGSNDIVPYSGNRSGFANFSNSLMMNKYEHNLNCGFPKNLVQDLGQQSFSESYTREWVEGNHGKSVESSYPLGLNNNFEPGVKSSPSLVHSPVTTGSFNGLPSPSSYNRVPSCGSFTGLLSPTSFHGLPPRSTFTGNPPPGTFNGVSPSNVFNGISSPNKNNKMPPTSSYNRAAPSNSFRVPSEGFGLSNQQNGNYSSHNIHFPVMPSMDKTAQFPSEFNTELFQTKGYSPTDIVQLYNLAGQRDLPHHVLAQKLIRRPGQSAENFSQWSAELHICIDGCSEQFKNLEKERKKTEAELARHNPGKKMSSANNCPVPRVHTNASRVDKLIVDQLREHSRVTTLVNKMEALHGQPLPHDISCTMDEWLRIVKDIQTRRKEEVMNKFDCRYMTRPGQQPLRVYDEKFIQSLTERIYALTIISRKVRTDLWCALTITLLKNQPKSDADKTEIENASNDPA